MPRIYRWLSSRLLQCTFWERIDMGAICLPVSLSEDAPAFGGALVVVVLITAIGAGIGTGSGWYGGRIEQAWMGIWDVFLAFPGLVLALAVAGVSGGGMLQAVLALAAIGWPKYARLPSQERSC